eukprot:TRINITY_DN487_c0_g1_i3.p1 TRINITY_DN487_c0_g1~~TRINITY_DN487_c0_g1_i3.p1  ORF type:complete len:558 (-),score=69.63 TRINITY_DN487_c0_g1_i3:158-1831(-)
MFPFVAGPVVMAYNLPNAPSNSTLVIGREVLVGIYSNQIQFWNDSQIIADQENPLWISYLRNTSQKIIPVIRFESSGTTNVFSNALSHFSSEWASKYGRFDSFPASFRNGTVASFRWGPSGNYGVMNVVGATPYAIGYVSLSVAKDNEWTSYAKMKNKYGNVVPAQEAYITSAISNAVFDHHFNADLVDLDGSTSYPIIAFSYLIIQTIQQPYHDCAQRRALWKYFHYTLTDPSSSIRAVDKGFSSLPVNTSISVLKLLANVSCNGTSLLSYSAVTQYDASFLAVVSTILVLLTIISSAFLVRFVSYLFSNEPKLPFPMIIYAVLICSSGIIGYAGVGMWLIVPTTSHVCMARVWLGTIGLSVILSTNISRASQIQKLNAIVKSNRSTQKLQEVQQQGALMMFRDVAIVFMIQVVIDIIWQTVDPYSSRLVPQDDFQLLAEWQCQSDSLALWIIELVFMVLVCFYGVIQIYRSWSITSRINQSKWILLSLYNVILTGTACLPIVGLVTGEKNLAIVAVSGLTFIYVQIQFSFLLPTIVYEHFKSTIVSSLSKKSSKS